MAHQQLSILLWAVATIAVHPISTSEMSMLEVLRYFPNNTQAYQQFVCTREEQECFKENKLWYETDGRCYSVGGRGPCAVGEIFHADKAMASRRGGHLRGTCEKLCPGEDRAPVAATGECMARSDVEKTICRANLYLRAALDIFGQWVCQWTTLICKTHNNFGIGRFPGEYSSYSGICSAPDIFRRLIDGGKNATVPDEKPADHPLLEYFFNETILQREFLCTNEEKACLEYGRILSSDRNCYSPNQYSSRCEPTESFHLDLNEAKRPGGRLIGTCRSPCKNFKHPQIKTGQCVDYMEFSNQVCRYEWGMNPQVDVFGRMTCGCGWSPDAPPKPPPSLPQPASTPGHCRAPNFDNPVAAPTYDTTLSMGFQVPCSEEEYACLREGKVLVMGECHVLRTRGPCAQLEELVLDKEALVYARLQPKCIPSLCLQGRVPMAIDHTCLTYQEVRSLLCPGQKIALDEFGGWQCDFQENNWPGNLTRVVRHSSDGTCELPEKYGAPFVPAAPFGSGGGIAASAGKPAGGFGGGSGHQGGFNGGHHG